MSHTCRMAALIFVLAILIPAHAVPRVVSSENGGLLFTDNQAGISGTDAGLSVPVGERTLWLFGDVFLLAPKDPKKPYVGGVSNCGLLAAGGSGAAPLRDYTVLTDAKGLARSLIPNAPDEDDKIRLWPGASWYDSGRQRLFTFYGIVRILGEGTYNFRGEGTGLAVADVSRPLDLSYTRLKTSSGWVWWPEEGPQFGTSLIADKDSRYLYVAGRKARKGKMARVPRDRIADLSAWEYYAGGSDAPRWSRNVNDAADVAGLSDFPADFSISRNDYLDGYLAVHNIVLDDRIRISLAPHPWGPYTEIAVIGAPRQAFQDNPVYAGREHPELAEDGGRVIYLTYVDSRRYWLQLLKVTLAK